jgi:antibiotic biosynthesis monooxygenase (ABM) superfamily enzyme
MLYHHFYRPIRSKIITGSSIRNSTKNNNISLCYRYHHPNPFDPKTTKGWKAALKVCFTFFCMMMMNVKLAFLITNSLTFFGALTLLLLFRFICINL